MFEAFPELSSGFNFWLILRLVVAAVYGGVIGFERGGSRHEAGLRTHIIVCLGAAGVMIVGELLGMRYGSDVTRLSAQVISGVGFLGAGSIIMDGSRIRGITTAAGIWTTACVGLIVGAGYFILSAVMVVIMMVTMIGLKSVTKRLQEKSQRHVLKIQYGKKESIKEVLSVLLDYNATIKAVNTEKMANSGEQCVVDFTASRDINFDLLIAKIMEVDDVDAVIPHTGF